MSDDGDLTRFLMHEWDREDRQAECGEHHLRPGQIRCTIDEDGDYMLAVSSVGGHNVNVFYCEHVDGDGEGSWRSMLPHMYVLDPSDPSHVVVKPVPGTFMLSRTMCAYLDDHRLTNG